MVVTLKLGGERTIKKIRAYIQDGTNTNYLRDGRFKSAKTVKRTDVVTVEMVWPIASAR